VNLAWRDVRHRLGRFLGVALGLSLLFTVVLAMAGIYQGLVEDATSLSRAMHADLWVVQRDTYGPFADSSRIDPTVEWRAAAVAGVTGARSYSYQVLQREQGKGQSRFALVGLAWPEDRGQELPLVSGRELAQAHGEVLVDVSLGIGIGQELQLAGEPYTVVGLTRGVLTTGGDPAAFMTIADAQLVLLDTAPDAVQAERARRQERFRTAELGRAQPGLADLLSDPRWKPPVLATPSVHAVLVNVDGPDHLASVRKAIASWPDVSVFSQSEQEDLLVRGVVEKARLQLGMFAVILVLTSSVVFAVILYNMTLDKTHAIALLRLIGSPARRIVGMVLQQAWMLGLLAYALAVGIGSFAFPHFPRRVVLTDGILWAGLALVVLVSTLSSTLGVRYAMGVDAGKVLEG
jgi:putative ABC transport system permease protein